MGFHDWLRSRARAGVMHEMAANIERDPPNKLRYGAKEQTFMVVIRLCVGIIKTKGNHI